METVHAIALLQDAALGKLEEAVAADGRSAADIFRELDDAKGKDYKAQSDLIEALRQRLDIGDIRGAERPKDILEALNKVYASDQYSDARQELLNNEMPKDDPDLLVDALTDVKFSNSDRLLYSITDDAREKIYETLKGKNAAKKLVGLVSATKDHAMKIHLFEDLAAWLPQNPSDEAKKEMDSFGGFNRLKRDVGFELFKEDRMAFFRFLEGGTINIEGLEGFIKNEPDESLKSILLHVKTKEDASLVMKFIRSKDALLAVVPELDRADIPPDLRDTVANIARRLVATFDAPPQIYALGRLRQRDASVKSYDEPNKFIIALRDGESRATIAWSNTKDFYEHKDLARRIGGLPKSLCAGGTVELTPLEDGRTRVVFKGRSGTYGPYNDIFLAHFKESMAEYLRREIGTEVEMIINASD